MAEVSCKKAIELKNQNNQKEHIVFLGVATFPTGFGAVQRMTLMGKALIHGGYRTTVVCRKGGIRRGDTEMEFGTEGIHEGTRFVYMSEDVYRPEGFLDRNLSKITGIIKEYRYLSRLKKSGDLTAAIISNHSAHHVFRYKLFSKMIGFPVVLNFVELASSMKDRSSIKHRLNDYFLDKQVIKTVDGALPISEKLMDHYRQYSPSKPVLKLPIICDFSKFDPALVDIGDQIILYCGAASYSELVQFIVDAFDRLENLEANVYLQLILGGTQGELKNINELISNAKNESHIRLVTNVPHNSIPEYYSKASALLIPLRPNLQDEARFPHKIGEYLASGRPMITTRFGEIKHYDFDDGENTLIAEEYEVAAYAEKMKYVLDHPEKSKEIGQRGRQMGEENFDYTAFGERLREYFSALRSTAS